MRHICVEFPVQLSVSEHNSKQVLDIEKPGMVRVLPRRHSSQRRAESPQSDTQALMVDRIQIALEPTDERIHRQRSLSVIRFGTD